MASQLRILGNTDLSALAQEDWDTTLRMQSTPTDIFGELVGLYSQEVRMLPDAIVMKLPFKKGVYRQTIALLMNLSNAGVNGRTDQEGAEEGQVLKYFTAYSNDYSHAVNTEQYGLDAHTKEGWGLLKMVEPQLSTWHKEKEGQKARQALLQRYDLDLVAAPASRTQHWNRNMLVKNVSMVYSANNQPTYSHTLATYTENIGDAIQTAGSSASWDMKFMSAIQYFATSVWELEGYVDNRVAVTVPAFQSMLLRDISTTGTYANLAKDSFIKEIAGNAWKWYLGSVYNLDIFIDDRAPVLERTGADGSYALTATYRGMGTTDTRPTTGTLMDVGFVCGKAALVKAEHERLHFEEEARNYGKRKGIGAFRGMAYNALEYDIGTASATSRRNQSSGVVLARRTSATA
jgi:hypothetical protein